MVGQEIRPGILGEIREELEAMKRQETSRKGDDKGNPRRGRS